MNKFKVFLASFALAGTIAVPQQAKATHYNRLAAVSYASYWVWGRNGYYTYLGDNGGDCTNFVSQCLAAGGWQNSGFYDRTNSYNWFCYWGWYMSYTWGGAPNFKQFLDNSGRATRVNAWQNLTGGDVIVMDENGNGTISHSVFVLGRNAQGTIMLGQHSPGEIMPLYYYWWAYPNARYYFYHIKDEY